jgi:hypothetical protein
VLLFGAWFMGVGLYAAVNSLTVEVDTRAIRSVRRVLGWPLRTRCVPVAAIAALDIKTAVAPRGLGGATQYRLYAVAATGAAPMMIADGVPDKSLIDALAALIARCAQLPRGAVESAAAG